ncbi:MAG: HlyD family efflux transporter periplasmic adaptor subunit [Anaerolineae bacterium]|nr:HlyD family efflux transporter periplasmic adaptor subunit [Anaerolineae bacterium]
MKSYKVLIVIGFAILLLAACQQPAGNPVPTFVPPTPVPTASPRAASTMTTTVALGEIVDALETRGRIEARRETNLVFPLDGTLKGLHVAPGDQVTQGQLLAELSAVAIENEVIDRRYALDLAHLQLAQAELISQTQGAEIEQTIAIAYASYNQVVLQGKQAVTNAQLSAERCRRTAEDDLDYRQCDLYVPQAEASADAANAVAAAQLWAARMARGSTRSMQDLNYSIAQIQYAQAEMLYLQASQQMTDTQLIAPFSGVLLSVEKRVGEGVSAYQPIGVLSDPTELWAIATIFEEDAYRVAIGQRVELVLDAYLDRTYHGTVLQIASQAVLWQGKWAYDVTIIFDEDQDIPATMRMGADIRIIVRTKENVLLIPTQAIILSGGRQYVERVQPNGAVQQVEIETGMSTGSETEVLSGLEAGHVIRIP